MKNRSFVCPIAILLLLVTFITPSRADSFAPSAEETEPLQPGAKAPEGTYTDSEGREISITDLVRENPIVLVYYRGDWCPYCNQHLRNLKEIEKDLIALGVSLIAISPDKPEILARTEKNEDLPYRLFSDASMEMARKFGIAFKVSDETIEKYKGYKIDLEEASGYDHHLLPVPAVFLIDTSGTILWTHSDPDYKKRLDSHDLLDIAKEKVKK